MPNLGNLAHGIAELYNISFALKLLNLKQKWHKEISVAN